MIRALAKDMAALAGNHCGPWGAIADPALGLPLPAAIAQSPDLQVGVAAPACVDQTQAGLNICAAQWLKTAEYLESLVYDDLYQGLSVPNRLRLAIAEEYWRAYRQSQCQFESDPYDGGSLQPMIYGHCMAALTNQRIADLQGWAAIEPQTLAAAEAQLQGLLQALAQTTSPTQQYWEGYRTAHCSALAAIAADQAGFDLVACQSQLTQARRDRLERYQSQRGN